MKFGTRILAFAAIPVVGLLLFFAAQRYPGLFSNVTLIEGLLLLEIIIMAVWHYEKWFFVMLMIIFLWAGSALPFAGSGSAVRWVFLFVGAMAGLVKWAERNERKHFRAIHLVALLCVLSAVVTATVSKRTEVSLLKSASVFLLFLYASCGARVAMAGREGSFFQGLLRACEIMSYVTAGLYGILRFQAFGNANSLGAIMGVVVVPVLLWGVLITEDRYVRHRRTLALCLAAFLLYSSVSRAAILACAIAVTVMCFALRRHALFIKGAFIVLFLAAGVAVVQPSQFDALVTSFTEDVIYKGKTEQGLLGSRTSPWQETVDVIRESPWFGSGFGTDLAPSQPSAGGLVFSTAEGSVREHGNSYLALLEYVGLLGIIPFLVLLGFVLRQIVQGCSRMWRTADPSPYAVPLVVVCIAGVVHAFFEDWLFAVGYYLNIFFWISVFLLSDLQAERATGSLRSAWGKATAGAGPLPLSAHR